MIVGGIGSEARCEFTVIGSTVNLASRLESLNRSLETNCLTSESVADKLHPHWHMESRGGQRVKGVSGEIGVFELRAKKEKKV
jgi:adenylate cyclase